MRKNLLRLRTFVYGSFFVGSALPMFGQVQPIALASVQSAHRFSQQNQSQDLVDVLKELSKDYGVIFDYNPKVLKGKSVSLDKKESQSRDLDQILNGLLTPHKLTFEKNNNHSYIIYLKKEKTQTDASGKGNDNLPYNSMANMGFVNSSALAGPVNSISSVVAFEIKGQIKDDKGEGLPGVSVSLKGTTNGTITDSEGKYAIIIPEGTGTLVFSFVGYVTEEVPVNNQNTINVTLLPDIMSLNEVVVTAMGIKKEEKALGYAVSTVTAEQITKSGNTNFASALYGKAAGVKITTAPGGSGSAVNVQIRGINSLNNNKQPIYVVDGVIIRNDEQYGTAGANNNNYDSDQRIRGNGVLDINPSDIESLSVLKGASATALYGSDASSGVIVITTKKGAKGKGLGVDVNYTGTLERVAFLPKFQNTYGPGYDRETNMQNGATAEGWIKDGDPTVNGGLRPYFRSYANFGPKMDGRQVSWWDGSTRAFSAEPNNYRDVFDKGYSSNLNIGLSNQTDKISYRLSATRLDYKSTNPGSKQQKTTFNLNSTAKLNNNVSVDVVVSYINTLTHNRAYQLGRVLGSFDGFFSRAEDMSLLRDKYQTSQGYKYVRYNVNQPEAFRYNIRPTGLLDFYWNQLRNSYDETENRLITSGTLNWKIINHLNFRGRIGNDYTGLGIENKEYNQYATAYNTTSSSTGAYGTSKGQYAVIYGDALLTYNNKLGSDLDYSVSGGFQGRSEHYKDQESTTTAGLVTENWFSLNNSYGILNTKVVRKEMLKYAYLGILNLSYKNFLFLEGTARQEYTSTLPVNNNQYFYWSTNGSFVFTDVLELPTALSYGKLRASYGVVGNGAGIYKSNILYNQSSLQTINGSVPKQTTNSAYGNSLLEPEKKYETELGLETRFLNNKFGVDVTYYTNVIKNQILDLNTSPSNGANSQIVNIGEIGNRGVEIAFNATPISGSLRWDTRINYAFNRSRVISLTNNISEINFTENPIEAGSIKIVANVGETLGNIYTYERAKNENGDYIINNDGLYVIDKTKFVKVGNIMPKAIGGFSNTISYKNLSLDFTIDYRFGGQMISAPTKYGMAAGQYKNTLQYRDAEHGGLTYTDPIDGQVHDDGVLLEGVNEATGEPNTKVISAATYYFNTFNWGSDTWNSKGAIYDNSYIKMREITLAYKIPSRISDRLHLNNLRISLVGRNLFYIWRTLENVDPEAPLGNKWWSQGLDVGSSAPTRSFGFSLNASF
ncbi:SusC/RagA family TonB-linked outer membrane protein [Cytophagaceae bacterium DM2B3-1]|uniref:SusC/RagA family TonB-linked outer membrane protein n=1 Tax=Xanthocytophaga flava TaxID=3048013 RepID=A0ABT7CXI6_9BACT|nr:SusC/RagA family TonB-linked outer membrane protein [Xanthocytophaga flavus]MDJ1469135.1 SusC/RagA family TonB-linked outer membrane protein [Xanthocytophaga flavus]MDJ1497319.1 SusC/RagA family TonB-linked outer membrane protein [Xanthocytophaga flavus]